MSEMIGTTVGQKADTCRSADQMASSPKSTEFLAYERWARSMFLRVLQPLESGQLILEDEHGPVVLGQRETGTELVARVRVERGAFYPAVLFEGSVGAGRTYMEGHWSTDDLTAVVRILARNQEVLRRWGRGLAQVIQPAHRLLLWAKRNTVDRARRNIHEHYDLGNDFFASFLDPSMMYSCAIYPHAQATLEEAAAAKVHRICRKLDLGPADHLLEIGTGWGGFAITAARDYGCRVTTTTISEEQAELARQRVREAGLEEQVTILQQDYRELGGQYDKLVSIEMIEAVGPEYLDDFFEVCSDRLKADGRMLLQAIVIDDRQYENAARSVDFIKRYIFPGSFMPSPGAIATSIRRATDLRPIHLEDLTPHYARTLHDWQKRFVAAADRIRAMGFDESFLRRWRFYFSYCEGGFAERRIGVQQLMYAKPRSRERSLLPALEALQPGAL